MFAKSVSPWNEQINVKSPRLSNCNGIKPNKSKSQPPIIGQKRLRNKHTNSIFDLNPKPPKRAKTPQLIDDYIEEDDDLYLKSNLNPKGMHIKEPMYFCLSLLSYNYTLHNVLYSDTTNDLSNITIDTSKEHGFQLYVDNNQEASPSPIPSDTDKQFEFATTPKGITSPKLSPIHPRTAPKKRRSDKEEMDADSDNDNDNNNKSAPS